MEHDPMLRANDLVGSVLSIVLLWMIFLAKNKKYKKEYQQLFKTAFWFKMLCSVIFSLIAAYYYNGGDTEMFLYAVRDIQQAISVNDITLPDLFLMPSVEDTDALSFHFIQDNTLYPVMGFMRHASNFLVPKLGIIPYYIFFDSYLGMCFVFSFFALAGTIRLYKLFLHYFPKMQKEIALATLFLPSVCYWSSGFLKDSICFGSVGFLLYGLFNVFIKRRKLVASLFWIGLSIYFLYTIKVYILLALIPGIGFWLMGELSGAIKNVTLRRATRFMSLIIAGIGGYLLINYLTSESALSKFNLDNLLESSDYSRKIFEKRGDVGSNFQFSTTNPVLLMLNGLVATFFRPFPWEVNSLIVMFSALESFLFLTLLVWLIYKKGFIKPFRQIISNPILLLSFTFALIFAVTVGISTTNFGSLSRYKIPCLPFYLMFILGAYHLTGVPYPVWMKKVLKWLSYNRKDKTIARAMPAVE